MPLCDDDIFENACANVLILVATPNYSFRCHCLRSSIFMKTCLCGCLVFKYFLISHVQHKTEESALFISHIRWETLYYYYYYYIQFKRCELFMQIVLGLKPILTNIKRLEQCEYDERMLFLKASMLHSAYVSTPTVASPEHRWLRCE